MQQPSKSPSSATDRKIAGWQLARHLTLGTIVLAGSLVLGLDTAERWNQHQAAQQVVAKEARHSKARVHTYAGIGVELERVGRHQYIRRVFADSPAQGKIFPGARLESVDGIRPGCARGWAAMIRGPIGSEVNLELSYDGRRHEVSLERDLIMVHY